MSTPRGISWGVAALTIAGWLAVLGIVLANARATPGTLSEVHGREAGLDSETACAQCHGSGGKASMTAACTSCHAEIAGELASRRGLHGRLDPAKAADCALCHDEHHGRDFAIVNRRSWQLADHADPATYEHAGLDFTLKGRHASIACEDCHKAAGVASVAKGQKRFLGLAQACTSCHEDVHKGSFGAKCAECHGQEHAFNVVAGFRHTDRFRLTGAHAKAACIDCHAKDGATAVGALMTPANKPVRTCVECHASPHGDAFLAAFSASCTPCHDAGHDTFQSPPATLSREAHALVGMPLTAPHDKAACAKCHEGYGRREPLKDAAAYRALYPGRKAERCEQCHADPHGGQFEKGALAGSTCTTCHAREAFLPHGFDAKMHDRTAFALHGAHRKAACSACHTRASEKDPRQFHGTATSCRACHRDPHDGQFEKGAFRGLDCDACHRVDSFSPPEFTLAMHARTAFPLDGKHDAVGCNACHTKTGSAARAFVGTPAACDRCHTDAHRGRFDAASLPAREGVTGCARCHTASGFRMPPKAMFDHATWTNHALKGAHANLDCAACHQRAMKPDEHGRTFGWARGTKCQSCHQDPHVAQFGAPDTVRCDRCHRETTFRDVAFDHQKDSRFKLDEQHAKLACSACHREVKLSDGTKTVRYKPLGITCADCHAPTGPGKEKR